MGMQIGVFGCCFFVLFFLGGGARTTSRLYFQGRNSPPVASGSVAATVKGRKVNILSLPFYLKRNKKKKKKEEILQIQNPQLSEAGAVIK